MPTLLDQYRAANPWMSGYSDQQLVNYFADYNQQPADDVAKQLGVSQPGNFMRGIYQAGNELAGAGAGLVGLMGNGVNDDVKQWGLNKAQQYFARAQAYDKPTDSLSGIHSLSDAGAYAAHGLGSLVGNVAPAMATGGIGSFLVKRAAQVGVKMAAEEAIQASMVAGVPRDIAEQQVGRLVAEQGMNSAAKAGAIAGVAPTAYGQEAGSLYPEMVQQGDDSPGKAALYSIPGAAAAFVPELAAVRRFSAVTRPGTILQQGALQAAGSVAQTATNRAALGQSLADQQAGLAYADAGVSGLMGGAAFGAVMHQPQRTPQQLSDDWMRSTTPVDLTQMSRPAGGPVVGADNGELASMTINPYDAGGRVTAFRQGQDTDITSPQMGLFGGGAQVAMGRSGPVDLLHPAVSPAGAADSGELPGMVRNPYDVGGYVSAFQDNQTTDVASAQRALFGGGGETSMVPQAPVAAGQARPAGARNVVADMAKEWGIKPTPLRAPLMDALGRLYYGGAIDRDTAAITVEDLRNGRYAAAQKDIKSLQEKANGQNVGNENAVSQSSQPQQPGAAPAAGADQPQPGGAEVHAGGVQPNGGQPGTQVAQAPQGAQAVQAVLGKLPAVQQKVVGFLMDAAQSNALHEFVGADGTLAYQKIADATGMARGSAKSAVDGAARNLAKAQGLTVEQFKAQLAEQAARSRQVEGTARDQLGLSPAKQASVLDPDAAASMGEISSPGGSQGAVGRGGEEPQVVTAAEAARDEAYNEKRQQLAIQARHQAYVELMQHPEAKNAAVDWNASRSDKAPAFEELTPTQQMELVHEYINQIEEDPSSKGIDNFFRDFERQLEPAHEQTPQIEAKSAGEGAVGSPRDVAQGNRGEEIPEDARRAELQRLIAEQNADLRSADHGPEGGEHGEPGSEPDDRGQLEHAGPDESGHPDELSFEGPVPGARNPTTVEALRAELARLFVSPAKAEELIGLHATQADAEAAGALPRGLKPVAGVSYGGRAHLIAAHIESGKELGTILHEVGVHVGLSKLLGIDGINDLARQVDAWAARNDGSLESQIAQRAVPRAERSNSRGANIANEERVAYFMTEAVNAGLRPGEAKGPVATWFNKLVQGLKAALRKLGFKNPEKLSAQDLVDMAAGAARQVVEGEPQARQATDLRAAPAFEEHPIEAVRAIERELPAKAKDAWTNIKDWTMKVGPALMTNFQLAEQFGKRLGSLKDYVTTEQRMDAMRRELEGEAHKVVTQMENLSKNDKNLLSKLMLDTTLARVHPDLARDDPLNRHLTQPEAAQYDSLHSRYMALSPEAKSVYQAARDNLANTWQARREAYADTVAYTYDKRIQTALDNKDEARAEKLKAERDEAIRDHAEQVKNLKGPYFPLMRFGQHVAVAESPELAALKAKVKDLEGKSRTDAEQKIAAMERQEKHYVVTAHETRAQAERQMQAMQAKGMQTRYKLADEFRPQLRPVTQRALDEFGHAIDSAFGSETGGKVKDLMTQIYIRSLPEHAALTREQQRKGIQGASSDMLRAYAAAAQKDAFYLSRLKYAPELTSKLFQLKEEAKGADLSRVAQEMEARAALDMTYQRTPIQNALSSLSWAYHLGVSPAFLFTNSTQPWMLTAPVLAGKFGLGRSIGALRTASVDALHLIKDARLGSGKVDWWSDLKLDAKDGSGRPILSTPEQAMVKELINRGVVDVGMQHDMAMFANDEHRRLAKIQKVQGWAVQQVELLNRISSALASYRLAKSRGMDERAATEYAYDTTAKTQFDYSEGGAARAMRQGGPVPLAKLVFQFRKYQQGVLYLLASNIKNAVAGDKDSMKALAYLTASQGLVAGALGLPFAGSAMWIANQFMDDDDERGDAQTRFRNWLAGMTGDTKTAAALAKGLPALFGNDLSNRLGMGDVAKPFPMARFDGKTGADKVGQGLSALVGPAAGVGAQWLDAYKAFAGGDWQRGVEKMAPKELADLAKAYRFGNEGMTDSKGRMILRDDQFNGWDLGLRALGFTPTREADYYDANQSKMDVENAIKDERSTLINQWVHAKRLGNDAAGVEERIQAFNEAHPSRGEYGRIDASTRFKALQAERKAERERGPNGVRFQKSERALEGLAAYTE